MQTNKASLSIVGVLVVAAVFLVIGIIKIQHAYAQADATSSESATDAAPVESIEPNASVPTEPAEAEAGEESTTSTGGAVLGVESGATTDEAPAAGSEATEPPPQQLSSAESPPEGLTEVHIIGT